MPNTPDPGHRYHFHSLLRDLAGGTRLPDGGLPDGTSCKEQGQPSPSGTAPPGGLHSDGRALNYSHRGQFLIIFFPDGIYLNLYITCNFSNSFLFLFYFFPNSIFGIRLSYCEEIMLI